MAGYLIGDALRIKLRETINKVAEMPEGERPTRIETRFEDLPRVGTLLRRGTFTHASWAVGSTMQVTVHGSTNTTSVTNYCVPVNGQTNATQTLNVIFGSIMGTVTAVEIEQPTCTLSIGGVDLTELPGYVAGDIQMLGHAASDTNSTACLGLQWYSVTQCASTAA